MPTKRPVSLCAKLGSLDGKRTFAAACINDNYLENAAVLYGQLKFSFPHLSESQQRIQCIHIVIPAAGITANNLNLRFVGTNCNFVFQNLKINNR